MIDIYPHRTFSLPVYGEKVVICRIYWTHAIETHLTSARALCTEQYSDEHAGSLPSFMLVLRGYATWCNLVHFECNLK